MRGVPRALALAVAFSAALIAVHLIPGLLGVFVPIAVLVTALLGAGGAVALAPRAAPPAGHGAAAPDPRAWLREPDGLLAAGAALVVAGCALALTRDLAGAAVTAIDAQNFQLPIVARWVQTESLWGLHQFIPDYSNATYPMHGNVLVAAFVLPFESAFLARLVAVPFWGLAGAAVYATGRELGAGRAPALLAGAALAAVPVAARSGLEGVQTDAPMLAFLATGVLFLVRHARTRAPGELWLAGAALGLAFGTKWYAVTSVAAIVAVWGLARPPRQLVAEAGRVLTGAVGLAALVALFGGVWLLRNWIETGNPLFPQPLGPFDAPPDPLRDRAGFTLADYLLDWPVWREHLAPAFRSAFGLPGAALAAGAVAAALLRPPGRVVALLAGTAVLAALYFVTPYSAFGAEGRPVLAIASTRYGLPALLGAAVLTAWALGRLRGHARTVAAALLAVAVLDGVRRAFGELSVAKAVGGTVAAAALAWGATRLRGRSRPALAGLAAVALVVGLLGVDAVRRRANDAGYAPFDPVLAHVERHAPAGQRIALAGTWSTETVSPVLPAFGPRLRNDVEFLGEFREGMLRARTDRAALAEAAERYDLLIVGRGAPPRPGVPAERAAAAAGWEPVTASERLSLWQSP